MDGDILFDEALKKQWASLSASGYSTEQIEQSKIRKKHKDDVWMYTYMVQQHAWESDLSLDRVNVHLKLALALDAICRRTDAIGMLLEAIEDHPFDSRIVIALAKLFFRDDQKDLSLLYCQQIYNAHELKQLEGSFISVDDALNAYYLAGWIKIHDDNHTEAYQIWSEGSKAFPSCPVLLKQQRKRNCWDQEPSHLLEWIEQVRFRVRVRNGSDR
jgi:tetratricopeptide (TPR) repeat protein